MDGPPHDAPAARPLSDLTLHQAAELYAVSARTLAQHIRCGRLPACKTTGAHGREWRVTRGALAAAGYLPRQPAAAGDVAEPPLVGQLRREASAARRSAAAERRRAEDADRRLGHALLECGRLRAALAAATAPQGACTQADLDSAEARWVMDAFRAAPTEQRSSQGA